MESNAVEESIYRCRGIDGLVIPQQQSAHSLTAFNSMTQQHSASEATKPRDMPYIDA